MIRAQRLLGERNGLVRNTPRFEQPPFEPVLLGQEIQDVDEFGCDAEAPRRRSIARRMATPACG